MAARLVASRRNGAFAARCPERAHAGTLGAKPNTESGATRPHPATRAAPGEPGSNDRHRAGVAFQRLPVSRSEQDGRPDQGVMQIAIPPASNEPRINDRIRAREVLLVDSDGTKLGVKPFPEALQLAKDQDLDLVEVAANANPPVCRIMDYGKFRFDAAQRAKESKRKTTQAQIKEMKYRVKIGPGDFDTKTRKVVEFLREGHKVKITIMFRGRETAHPHLGKKILDRIADEASSFAKVEAAPKLDGRNMIMVLAPDRRAQQQQQAKAAKPASDSTAPAAPAAAAPAAAVPAPAPNGATPEQSDGQQQPAAQQQQNEQPQEQQQQQQET